VCTKRGGVILNIKEYFKPSHLDEAYELLQQKKGVVIGGGAFLHLGKRDIDAVVDISGLGLDYINEDGGFIHIGAMATLREIEESGLLKQRFDGILPKTAAIIMGVQIRNMATIGGCASGRYGFSDILTSLLALDAEVKLYKNGIMSLEQFIESKIAGDILVEIIIKDDVQKAAYKNVRNTATDFSILNAAAVKDGNDIRIVVGSRPGAAAISKGASEYISKVSLDEENAVKASEIAAGELDFGTDLRGSAEYRKELCKVLVKRCLMEVII
jgi:probable selenate reductase FAD-binding subunit